MKTYIEQYYDDYYKLSDSERESADNYNCCEITLKAANEKYNLGLNAQALKVGRCFGGGMAVEGMCGIITGSLMVLSIIFYNHKEHRAIAKEYIECFDKIKQSTKCNELKEIYRDEIKSCSDLIIESSTILEGIINKYTNQNT